MTTTAVEGVQRITATATYGGAGSAVYFGLTAHELAAFGGLLVAVVAGVANVWINWHYRRKHYRLAEEQAETGGWINRQRGAINRTLVAAVSTLSVSAAGLGFLAGHEGLRLEAYPDPGHGWRVPTICYGATAGVQRGQRATFEECNRMLYRDASYAGQAIARCTHVAITQGQYDALVAFAYNVGGAAYCRSTLARKLNAGDCYGAAAEFERWVFSGGQRLPGLVTRRAAERAMFESGCTAMLASMQGR